MERTTQFPRQHAALALVPTRLEHGRLSSGRRYATGSGGVPHMLRRELKLAVGPL